jgi:hypothetical protein
MARALATVGSAQIRRPAFSQTAFRADQMMRNLGHGHESDGRTIPLADLSFPGQLAVQATSAARKGAEPAAGPLVLATKSEDAPGAYASPRRGRLERLALLSQVRL